MGFLDYVLGTGSHSVSKISSDTYVPLSEAEVKKVLFSVSVSSLSGEKEKIVATAIKKTIIGNGTTNLQRIRKALEQLLNQKIIDSTEKKYIYIAFEKYFNNKDNK